MIGNRIDHGQEGLDVADFSNLCMGCMSEKGYVEICPYCGWVQGSVADSPDELYPGTLLNGRYIVGRKLGRGGFGVTYIGYDRTLRLKLAIKEYFPMYVGHRAMGQQLVSALGSAKQNDFRTGLEKFLDEARTLAQFAHHQNIVSVRDFFEANGTAYMVMTYIDGLTLEQYLEKQPGKRVSFETAFRIMTPVMDALRTVHRAGVIHRDISPDNIFITTGQQVRLLDFGAAKHALSRASRNFSVILKPGYAPFEQYYSTSEQGPWTDIYGVGATFYHLIAGQAPPESPARSDYDTLQRPSELGIQIEPQQEQALLSALAVHPQARLKSMDEFQAALGNVIPAPPPQVVACPYCRQTNSFASGQIAKGTTCSSCGKPLVRKKTRIITCPSCLGINEIETDAQPNEFHCSRCGQGIDNYSYRHSICSACALLNWVPKDSWKDSDGCVRCDTRLEWKSEEETLPKLTAMSSTAVVMTPKPSQKSKGLMVAAVAAVCFLIVGFYLFGVQGGPKMMMETQVNDLKLADGGVYTGAVLSGVPEGKGVLRYDDGRRFEGLFEKGVFVKGKAVTNEGVYAGEKTRYEGEMGRNGNKEGVGKIISDDGKRVWYEGEWFENLRHGSGKSTEPYYVKGKGNGKLVYNGFWEKGHKSGRGKAWIYGPDGKEVFSYSGLFRNDKMNDPDGEVFYADGAKYRGPISSDELNGQGTVTFKDGRSMKGQFQNDKLVKWVN